MHDAYNIIKLHKQLLLIRLRLCYQPPQKLTATLTDPETSAFAPVTEAPAITEMKSGSLSSGGQSYPEI